MSVAAGVVVVVAAVMTVKFGVGGKGSIAPKIAAIFAVGFFVWGMVAVRDLGTATSLAGFAARGVVTIVGALSSFLHAVFR
jgi:hypothetical protein